MSPRDLSNRTDKDPGVLLPARVGSSARNPEAQELWEEGTQRRRGWGLTPSWAQACPSGPFVPQATLYSPQVWPSQAPLLPRSHLCHLLTLPYLAQGHLSRQPRAARGWDPLRGAGAGARPAVASPSAQREAACPPRSTLGPEDLPTGAAPGGAGRRAAARYQGQLPTAPPRGGATTARPRLAAAAAAPPTFSRDLGREVQTPQAPLGTPPCLGFKGTRAPSRPELGGELP